MVAARQLLAGLDIPAVDGDRIRLAEQDGSREDPSSFAGLGMGFLVIRMAAREFVARDSTVGGSEAVKAGLER